MNEEPKIIRRVFAVLGAGVLLSFAMFSTANASRPTETRQSADGCESVTAQQNVAASKACHELNDAAGVTGTTTTHQPVQQTSSSDSYFESPVLWAVVLLAGAAGAFTAIIRRHHRPAALS